MQTEPTDSKPPYKPQPATHDGDRVSAKMTGPLRGLFALRNSIAGFKSAWREEASFRQEVSVFALFTPLIVALDITAIQRLLLVTTVMLVLIVELINSSIEAAIDRISLERHELSARAKDCASAAVTLSLLVCVSTWATICIPVLMRWLLA
jgi:diacylglycerol kinase (ATP)